MSDGGASVGEDSLAAANVSAASPPAASPPAASPPAASPPAANIPAADLPAAGRSAADTSVVSGGTGPPTGFIAGIRRLGRGRVRQNLLALLAYAALTLAMFGPWILGRMTTGFLSKSPQDGSIFLWMFRWWPYALSHRISPLFTNLVWAPKGINLAWVTSIPGPAVLLSPLTLAFGPFLSFNLVELAAPTLGAWTAYLLARRITGSFPAALMGGFFFGFSPSLIDEFGQGHPNLSLIFLIPLSAYLVLRLLEGSLRPGWFVPLLGLVLAAQLYTGTEVFATLTLMGALFGVIGYAASAPDRRLRLRRAIAPVAGAYLLAGVLTAPLLYVAFTRPRPRKPIHFATIGHGAAGTGDFLRYLTPGRFTIFWGQSGSHWGGYGNPWYLGIPLIVLLVLFVITERRRRAAWALAIGLLLTLALSAGDHLRFFRLKILPWHVFALVPVLNRAQPGRLISYAFLLVAIIVAMWLTRPAAGALRWALVAAAAVLILPNFSYPIWANRVPTPPFLATGAYHRYLTPGEIVWVVDPGRHDRQMIWQAQAGYSFRLAGGFLGLIPPGLRNAPIQETLGIGTLLGASTADVRAFLADHRVGAILVAEAKPQVVRQLTRATRTTGIPTGGVILFRLGHRFS